MWIADVASLVSRQTGINWQRAADSAKAVGAQRMLHTGLRLASELLNARLPQGVRAAVQADPAAARLVRQAFGWLPRPVVCRRICSSAPHSACACAGVGSPPRLTCCGFLFPPQRKIGRKAASSVRIVCSMCFAVPSVLLANTAAARGTDPQRSAISSCNKKEPRTLTPSAHGSGSPR